MDVVRKIKGSASTLKRYHEQLQELQRLSTSISDNPLLQTPEIGTQTDALLLIINNNCLNPLLRKGRLLRTLGFLYREQDLLDIFVKLEQQKSNLSLTIEQIQSKALYEIQTNIQVMANESPSDYIPSRLSSATKSAHLVPRGNAETADSANTLRTPHDPLYLNSCNPDIQSLLWLNIPLRPFQIQYPHYNPGPSADSPDDDSASRAARQPNGHTNPCSSGITYINATAGPGFDQVNGNSYRGSGKLSGEIHKNKPERKTSTTTVHEGSLKLGPGDQFNGDKYEFEGETTDSTVADPSRQTHINPLAMPYPSVGPGGARIGTQYNGLYVAENGGKDPEKQS
ncbi:hypothetical protein H9Q71_010994 [Fusarium xylarioides]|nr:hypothetical protein H9Q71_010994 [Fusarium xylarioides]